MSHYKFCFAKSEFIMAFYLSSLSKHFIIPIFSQLITFLGQTLYTNSFELSTLEYDA